MTSMYARQNSDKLLVQSNIDDANPLGYDDLTFITVVSLFYLLNFAIMIVGTYSISKIARECKTLFKDTLSALQEFYWAAVIVCAIVNSVCIAFDFTINSIDDAGVYNTFLLKLPLLFLLLIIEPISICILIKDFKIKDSICCCSNRHVLRAIHTLALSHILWFLHRIGCSLIVAMFFTALAPAPTLAVLSLMYFVIIATVLYVASILHFVKTKSVCKLVALLMLYCCIVGCLVCITLLFNKLAENGLTSAGLGSVILSLVAPTVVFLITLKIKHHVEKEFATMKAVEQSSNTGPDLISNQSAEGIGEPDMISNSPVGEATPLLPKIN